MALFKVNRGTSINLPAEMHDGWAYFCTDTAEFFIDYADSDDILHRKQINADEAKKLSGYDISNVLDNSDIEIPTSAAVFNAIKNGAVSWNDLQDKPFGDNADGTVNQMSGKYVEGMGYKETKNTIIFSGDIEMISEAMGDVFITLGTIPSGLSSIPDELTITVGGVSTVVKVNEDRFIYNGKNVFVSESRDDSGNWTNLSFSHSGNSDYIMENITIEAVTETIHPIDEKLLPDSVKAQSDWLQNDETAPDYVKNRFGGYYDDVDNLYVEEKTLTFTQNSDNPSLYELVNPEQLPYLCWEGSPSKIKIIFDGTEYVLNEVAGTNYYGNASLFHNSYEDTGEPIGIYTMFAAGEGADYEATDIHTTIAGSSHTVEIYTVISSPVAIPEKFTPTLATKISVEDAIQLKQQNLTTTVVVRSDGYAYGNGILITYSDNSYSYITRSLDEGNTWESIEIPEGFYKIVFGNGKFVAMPYSNFISETGNTIYYSVDGLTWTTATLPSQRRWRGLVYGRGLFLAFGRFDRYAYSEDGINWIQSSWPDDSDCEGACGVIYANEKFVVTDGTYVYSSVDGMTWDSITINSNLSIRKLIYGNGIFIGIDSHEDTYLYSTDGITWEEINAPAEAIGDIAYGANVFVMVSYYLSSKIAYYSSDGLNWTQINTGSQGGSAWDFVVFCENQFFATPGYGYNIMYSSDGIKWRSTRDILKDTGGTYITSRVYTALGIDEKIQAAIGAAMEAIY